MSQRPSSDRPARASTDPIPGALIRRNTREMSSVIKAEWKDKEKLIIGVVRQQGVQALEEECRKPRWKIWQSICPVHITTENMLQQTIDRLTSAPSTSDDPKTQARNRLIILASHDVASISFSLPLYFQTLTVLRVGRKSDTTKNGTFTHHLLTVDGGSTFGGIRLDRWQAEGPHNIAAAEELDQPGAKRKQQASAPTPTIYLGKGVRISTTFSGSSPFAALLANNLTGQQRDLLQQAVSLMLDVDMESQWWRTWKGKIANILGVVPATAEYAQGVKGSSAAGLLVNWAVGPNGLLHQMTQGKGVAGAMGGGAAVTTAVTTIMTAAGPAQLLAAGVTAAAYFVPWEAVFGWLRSSFSWMWEFIGMLWSRFKDWCAGAVGMGRAAGSASASTKNKAQDQHGQHEQQKQGRRRTRTSEGKRLGAGMWKKPLAVAS